MFRSRKNQFGTVLSFITIIALAFSPNVQAQGIRGGEGSDNTTVTGGSGRIGGGVPIRGGVVEIKVSEAEQDAALNFWTHEALAVAQPLDLMVDMGTSSGQPGVLDAPITDEATPKSGGNLGFVPAGLPEADANAIAQAAYTADWEAIIEEAGLAETNTAPMDEIAGSSGVYTSYRANYLSAMQKIYPHIWIGRVSFSTGEGTSYCSGTAINNNVMLTAAHCIYDTTNNRAYNRWVFTPAYRNGSAPYGSFAASTCWILTAWVNLSGNYSITGWARHDVAVCRMGRNSAGQTLNGAVGWAGRQWNFGYLRHFHNLGYPFFDHRLETLTNPGGYLRLCAAESFVLATDTRGMGCNFGPGISGGPWLIGYAPGVVQGWVDGVNSGLYINQANLYGPRFTSNNIVPLCNAAGC